MRRVVSWAVSRVGPHRPTVASATVRYLVDYAVKRGQARAAVLSRFSIDPALLGDIDGRFAASTLTRLWTELPTLLGEPDMALDTLAAADWTDPPLMLHIFVSAPSFGAGLARMAKYERINYDLADEAVTRLVVDEERACLMIDPERTSFVPPAAVVDSLLGILALGAMSTGAPLVPIAVELRFAQPEDRGRYEQAFGCPVAFAQRRDQLVLHAADLERPHPATSRTLDASVRRHADAQLDELDARDCTLLAVRDEIRRRLPDEELTVDSLASGLGLSRRTLQRRLTAEGTSVRELVDEQRRAIALIHIEHPGASLLEIAVLLGFADATGFTRAFTRWTGVSPADYRRGRRPTAP